MNQLEELVKETLASSDALALEESRLASSLRWIERQTNTRTNHAQMLVGLKEGLFLREFARRNSCRRVLEIGTFTGYSLACLADGVISASGIAKRSKATGENTSIIESMTILTVELISTDNMSDGK